MKLTMTTTREQFEWCTGGSIGSQPKPQHVSKGECGENRVRARLNGLQEVIGHSQESRIDGEEVKNKHEGTENTESE